MKPIGHDFWTSIRRGIDENLSSDPQAHFYALEMVRAARRGEFLLGFAWGCFATLALATLIRLVLP